MDLAVTASALGDGGSLEAVRTDFHAINDVLAELVHGCQQALNEVSPWLDLVDHIGGGGDEIVIRFSLIVARRQAWSTATRLAALSDGRRDAGVRADVGSPVRSSSLASVGFDEDVEYLADGALLGDRFS